MMSPVIIWLLFCLAALVLALVKPNAGRICLGLFFLAMAMGVNLVALVVDPQSYVAFGTQAFIPLYRWVFRTIIALNPPLFILLLMVYELGVGALLLSKRRAVKLGLIGGILFLLGITPLGVETLPNPVLVVALASLLTKEFDQSFLDILRAKRRPAVGGVEGQRDGTLPESNAGMPTDR
jgi:hypothetical protein